MKDLLLIVLALAGGMLRAQTIYQSGIGDGYGNGAYTAVLTTNPIYASGSADGYASGAYNAPPITNPIFSSGIADGYASAAYNTTPFTPNPIFNSGAADGYASGLFLSPPAVSNPIFNSGISDGYASAAGSNVKVKVQGFALLEGPYNTGTLLMNDNLRTAGLVPLTEPYTALGYANAGGSGGETTTAGQLAITGADAVVDWVRVELRNAVTPTTVVAARHGLLLRTGDIIDATTGNDHLELNAPPGSYYVVVRHRNHLGAMTAAPVTLSATTSSIDFSSTATATFGTAAQKTIGTVNALWAGNVNGDAQIRYTGAGNDRDPILVAIGGSAPNSTVTGQYRLEDVNMDGTVKYTGPGNDRDPILVNIGGSTPNNTRTQQLP